MAIWCAIEVDASRLAGLKARGSCSPSPLVRQGARWVVEGQGMRVLVIGSGGREHALAWKIAQSPLLTKLFIAPGNGGTGKVAENVVIDITDHKAVVDFCRLMAVDFVVVGPDAQVVAGLGDDVRAAGIACFCPSKAAGQLEGSKGFTKALCDEMGIPTAAYGRFDNEAAALEYVYAQG